MVTAAERVEWSRPALHQPTRLSEVAMHREDRVCWRRRAQPYRGTSLIRNSAGPYSRTMPRDLW